MHERDPTKRTTIQPTVPFWTANIFLLRKTATRWQPHVHHDFHAILLCLKRFSLIWIASDPCGLDAGSHHAYLGPSCGPELLRRAWEALGEVRVQLLALLHIWTFLARWNRKVLAATMAIANIWESVA